MSDEPVPEDIADVLKELEKQASKPLQKQKQKKQDKDKKQEQEQKQTQNQKPTNDLPPYEFFLWLKENKPDAFTSENPWKILEMLYEGATTSDIMKQLNVTASSVSYARRKFKSMYEYYKAKQNVKNEPDSLKPQPTRVSRKNPQVPEKIPKDWYSKSRDTTTFKEIDKTVAKALGSQFHDYALKREIYSRLGELLIYSLLQLGVVERDKIVTYSEQLAEDPDRLYFYVKEQLDAVLRITDPETLMRTWQENAALHRKVIALQATADVLSETLDYYATAIRVLLGLLNKKQAEKFYTWLYMYEFMRKLKVGGEKVV